MHERGQCKSCADETTYANGWERSCREISHRPEVKYIVSLHEHNVDNDGGRSHFHGVLQSCIQVE
jgi:hypothetical protein